mgnify:CR=1 FL=1
MTQGKAKQLSPIVQTRIDGDHKSIPWQEEIQRRQNAINRLGQELANATTDPPKSRILHKRIRDEELALGLAKRNQENDQTHYKEKEKLRREVTDNILASADIVATTLNR